MLHLLPQTHLSRTARARLAWLAILSGLLIVGCSEDPAPKTGDKQSIDNKGDGDSDDEGDGDSEDEGDGDSDEDDNYTPGDGDDSTSGDGDDSEFPNNGDGDGDVEIIDSDGGVHIPVDDAGTGSIPPPTDGGKWTLKKGSAPDCPEEIPPIPLLGGLCLGVYWSCGWENEAKQQYSCVCDWVHYICVPL